MALNIPESIQAGDSLKITATDARYPASDGWTMTLKLINAERIITITSSANGDAHEITQTPDNTKSWPAGRAKYVVSFYDGTDKYTAEAGVLKIVQNPETSGPVDPRGHVEKVLDAIEAVLENKATKDQLQMTFNGRSITHLDPAQLLAWRDKYRAELRDIERAERVKKGMASGRLIQVRFN